MNDTELLEVFARLFPEDGAAVVRAVGITSVDGAAELGGRSGALGGPEDARLLSYLRRSADMILVGAATAEAEGYTYPMVEPEDARWRIAQGLPEQPPIALITRRERPDALAALEPGASVPPRVLIADDSERDRYAVAAVRNAQSAGARRILVEGGPSIWANLIDHDALDEFSMTISPVLNPQGKRFTEHLDRVAKLSILASAEVGGFLMVRFGIA